MEAAHAQGGAMGMDVAWPRSVRAKAGGTEGARRVWARTDHTSRRHAPSCSREEEEEEEEEEDGARARDASSGRRSPLLPFLSRAPPPFSLPLSLSPSLPLSLAAEAIQQSERESRSSKL
eukprot:3940557-Rhodomonas_salina.2